MLRYKEYKMSEINKNSNELDDFSAAVRSKLENHQMPVDLDLWDSIHASISPSKPTNVRLWWWISTGSAAAIAFLLVFMHSGLERKTNNVAQNTKQQMHTVKNAADSNASLPLQESASVKTVQTPSIAGKQLLKGAFSANQSAYAVLIDNIEPNTESAMVAHNKKEQADSVQTQQLKLLLSLNASSLNTKASNKQQESTRPQIKAGKGRYLLSFAYGTHNSSQFEQVSIPASYSSITTVHTQRREEIIFIDNEPPPIVSGGYTVTGEPTSTQTQITNVVYDTIKTTTLLVNPGQLTDIHYWQPISFGLKIRNEFSKRLSVESGLVYTYLQTDYSYSGAETYNASLCLHYLGLPLSLNLKLWQNPRWEVYISGGGAVEKGLSAVFEKMQQGNSEVSTESKAVDGLQLSANTAAGVSYNFHPQLGLYCEPQVAYYFDNNQPLSIRTKQALVVNVQLGLRYQLNKKE